jgi:hypothetical protein
LIIDSQQQRTTGVSASPDKPLCVVTALAAGGSLRQMLNDRNRYLSWHDVLVCNE